MYGNITITVSKDLMTVEAVLDTEGDNNINYDYVESILLDKGIKAGINHDLIRRMCENPKVGYVYILAEGKAPTAGTDGYYEFFFDTEKKKYKPIILEDGSIDYENHRQLVKKGDLLAEYHPKKMGTFGFTVYANVLAPIPVKDMPRLHLYHVDKCDEKYLAGADGEPKLQDNNLSVEDLLLIDGDASNVEGSIIYTGDVHVKGDVLSGTNIVCDGNICVDGVVEGARLEAGKDIIVKGGIHGCERARIKAKGSINAPFVEEARLIAGDKITFNYSYNSDIYGENEVIAEGRLGQVIGGRIRSKNFIKVKSAGNSAGVTTKFQITGEPEEIDQTCKIVVEKEAFEGAMICFADVSKQAKLTSMEYHFFDGEICICEVGCYVIREVRKVIKAKPEVKPCVLLVDDEPIILKTFYSYLCADYNVKAVSSARDAFKLMETVLPDLILLDYNMPEMDGGQMLEMMRKNTWKWYSNVPVIFATGVTDKEVVAKCLSLYPQGYLTKPLTREELMDVVGRFFEMRRQQIPAKNDMD